MRPVHLTFSGMDNRSNENALPEIKLGEGKNAPVVKKLRNAVNVNFDNSNQVIFPRWGDQLLIAGETHSVKKFQFITLFVNSGTLYRLNPDNSATALKSGIGDEYLTYTEVGESVYFSNSSINGRIVNGEYRKWSPDAPPRQPDVSASPSGNMSGGEYRVAITWVSDQESATGLSTRVTVPEGGGISLSNFPLPPSDVNYVNIYVSSVNGEDLYLYDRYPSYIATLTLTAKICTIPLETQFLMTVMPSKVIQAHYGRILCAYGDKILKTSVRRYGLHEPLDYMVFDSDVQVIVSLPNVVYVGTEHYLYRIDAVGEVWTKTALQDCGAVFRSVCYSPDGHRAYFMSNRGIIEATSEKIKEITYNDVAMPFFKSGCTAYIEKDGLQYLVFIGREPTQNTLVNADYAASEAARGQF